MKLSHFSPKITAAALLALAAATTAHAQLPVTDGLVAHWDFEGDHDNNQGNSDLDGDATGYGITQAEFSDTAPPSGGSESGRFHGTNEYVDIENQVFSDAQFDTAWTVSAWFRAASAPNVDANRFIVFETSGSDHYTISLGLRQAGAPSDETRVQFFTKTDNDNSANIATNVPDTSIVDVWNHAAVTFEKIGTARTMTAYLNGKSIGSLNLTAPLRVPDDGFHIGTYRRADGRFFDGLIDDVAIWDRALAPAEILLLSGAEQRVVSSDADTGAGTLRDALNAAAGPQGTLITFDPSLDGETIALASQLDIPDGGSFTIDTLGLPNGITLSGGGTTRIFNLLSNDQLTLRNLTIADGNSGAENGGGIFNSGSLVMTGCTIRDCTAPCGGAITNDGVVILSACTLTRNHATSTGGIACNGGSGTFLMNLCTATGNTSPGIGGIRFFGGTVILTSSILTGNGTHISPPATTDLNNLTSDDPKLAPLGHYGGPTMTMHPLAGSPAILTGEADTTRTDQRGFTLTGPPTIGAVKLPTPTKVSDEAELRTALDDSGSEPGKVIRFAQSLNSGTITLSGTQLEVPGTANGLFIDASDLANGLTIDADGSEATPRRVLEIKSSATVALHGLTLTGGDVGGEGGGIFVDGFSSTPTRLTVSTCTVSDNRTNTSGGGIACRGNLSIAIHHSTVSNNVAADGAGIRTRASSVVGDPSVSIYHSTISNNRASFKGGGVFVEGAFKIHHSTISGNTAGVVGGIDLFPRSSLSLNNTIVAGNTASGGSSPDLRNFLDATITAAGNNLISSQDGHDPIAGVTYDLDAKKLAPLGHYGGPTMTMPPIPGSPAIDAATTSTRTTDQRGLPVVGIADIGAVEIQGSSDTNSILATAWETDTDGDGTPFGTEFTLGTDPFVADPGNFRNLMFTATGGIEFGVNADAVGTATWVLERSTDLETWIEIYRSDDPLNGNQIVPARPDIIANLIGNILLLFDDEATGPRVFYRFRALAP